jgi:hypothetical protein
VLVEVKEKHIKRGNFKVGPIWLACQDAFSLPYYCIQVTPLLLVLKTYNGSSVYSTPWPDSVISFRKKFNKGIQPKPFSFEIGEGNNLERVIQNIRNWYWIDLDAKY